MEHESAAFREVGEPKPVPMLLWCPECGTRHVDAGVFRTKSHHTHACQGCGMVWRPALVPTVGVQYLPGFKDAMTVGDAARAEIIEQLCSTPSGGTE
jgi:rubredoxin